MSINIRSRDFPNSLNKMLASQEGMNTAMSLQGDDALTLVEILDQVSRLMTFGASSLIPGRLSKLRIWTLRSGERVFASSGEFAAHRPSCPVPAYSRIISRRRGTLHLLLGASRMSGKAATMIIVCASKRSAPIQPRTCQKSNRYAAKDFTCKYASDSSWQRLFQEIVIWRRLSHPNVLPVLGVSPKLFPLCIITEWMVDGNIMDFTAKHPEVNRLRLVRPISVSLSLQILKYP